MLNILCDLWLLQDDNRSSAPDIVAVEHERDRSRERSRSRSLRRGRNMIRRPGDDARDRSRDVSPSMAITRGWKQLAPRALTPDTVDVCELCTHFLIIYLLGF